MTPTFSRGARLRSFGQVKLNVLTESPPCVGHTRFPVPSAAAIDLARANPKKSWARRWLRLQGKFV